MKKALFLSLFVCFFLSCSKDYNANNGASTAVQGTSISTIFSTMAVTPQTTTIQAEKGGTFYGSGGARYIIPANGFRTANGAAVTGSVQVETAEYVKRSDMIFSGIAPISNGEPLISGGECYFNASQGGQQLSMSPGNTYQVNLPQTKTPPAGMQLFTSTGSPRTTTSLINWQTSVDTTQKGVVYNGDTLTIANDSMQMCNADRFMSSPDFQTFTVTPKVPGSTINDSLLMAYALYDNYNGYWPMGVYGSITNGVISEYHVPNIPVHFVVVTIINGTLYAGILGATPLSGTNYNITLAQTTPTQLKNDIDAL